MVSIVIPIATGSTASRWNNTELRYALRSVERYLKGYGEVFIVGQAPTWLHNVTVIPATDHDRTYYKERNIFNKIMLACQDDRVTADFLFMNDDHFLLREFEAGEFPWYHEGNLSHHLKRTDPYWQTIQNAVNWFFRQGMNDNAYFDVHCPILYNKAIFRHLIHLDWELKSGYPIKTMYGHFFRNYAQDPFPCADSDPVKDLKITGAKAYTEIKALIKDRLFFSTNDNCRDGGMEAVLQEIYPNKSKYER